MREFEVFLNEKFSAYGRCRFPRGGFTSAYAWNLAENLAMAVAIHTKAMGIVGGSSKFIWDCTHVIWVTIHANHCKTEIDIMRFANQPSTDLRRVCG